MNTQESITHLLDPDIIDTTAVARHLDDLITDQDRRIRDKCPLSPIPLLWLAMAWAAGLEITITTGEAAALLRIAPEAVRRRIRNRRLLATKPAGSKAWLIPESALKQSVNNGSNHANIDQE